MRTKPLSIALAVLALGLIATLVSGFYEQNLSKPGLSKFAYGFPISWHGNSWIVYPGMTTVYWYSLESFALDTAFWCLIFALLTLALPRLLCTEK